jgi:hypothetical protein
MNASEKTQSNERFRDQSFQFKGRNVTPSQGEHDFAVDGLMANLEDNPLGRLLSIISQMPEMRDEKLEIARRHIQQPDDVLEAEMDAAMDKVLEELISE